jgi:DeoR/GlpR family transcriptional regulator of sugar metabolism
MSEQLFLEERRRAILKLLEKEKRVSVKALSDTLNVSAVTIRQDLRVLEEEGVLERTHGGAVLPLAHDSNPELSFAIRQRRMQPQKEAIARKAATLVQDGFSIALDASTSAFAIIPFLKERDRLIIVTNSLMVAQQFLDSPHIKVLMPGGQLRRDSNALVGAPETLPDVNLNIGFFGARGISVDRGITETDPNEVNIKQAMLARCLSVVIVAHGAQIDRVAPYSFATLKQVNIIITTDEAPADTLKEIEKHNVKVSMINGCST